MKQIKRYFTKADLWLAASFLLAILLLQLFLLGRMSHFVNGSQLVCIYYDNQLISQRTCDQDCVLMFQAIESDRSYRLKEVLPEDQENMEAFLIGASGYNLIRIKDGCVRLLEADCPDLICVKHKEIARPGENIICLPHRLTIVIVGSDSGDKTDAVTW